MKKLLNLGALCLLAVLQSCEEKGVLIDFSDKNNFVDTTYTAAVETPQNRNVLVEEFTGASCTNCPDGHATVASLIATNGERVVAVAYHTFNGGAIFKPVKELSGHNSAYDFRDSAATNIGDVIFGGVTSIPKAGIDRVTVGSSKLIDRNVWASEVNKRLAIASPVNLYVTSSYNSTDDLVSINVKAAYTKSVSGKNILTLGVIESDIIDAQKYPDSVDMHYNHTHVFRKCLTPFYGKAVLDSVTTKQAGTVYEYNYSFKPAPAWKLENCKIVAFISNNEADNKEILQAKEVKVK
ncbi:MAG: Omp28-related outer membrane protein [Chitinophagaceae bacterium]|jgi:hypothetical protein